MASQRASTSAAPATLPPCGYGSQPALSAGLDQWALTLVDTTFRLPPAYVPPDLVPVARAGLAGWGEVRALVIDDLRSMAEAASQAGVPLAVQSAYRSFARQRTVFDGWVTQAGRAAALQTSARPGHSEHQLGTTLDLRAAGGSAPWIGDFARSATGRWLASNAWRFGFVVSYPPDTQNVTCYAPEAWHVRYVGLATAHQVHDSGLTLRAWLWAQDVPVPADVDPGDDGTTEPSPD